MRPKVYIGKLLPEKKSYLPVLYPNLGRQHKLGRIFLDRAYDVLTEPVVDLVDDPSAADYLLIPYDFFNIEKFSEYINSFVELSEKHNKKIIIFDFSDFDREVKVENSRIFRVSAYKSSKRPNEIVIPPFIEGLPAFAPRPKSGEPTVGFAGFAKFSWKNLLPLGPRRTGLYFRRKAMSVFEGQQGIKTNFIKRHGFSGHKDTIDIDPEIARKEFLKNMENSDLILAPKGDGNYSLRFFESLCFGRVPILIDTDNILPLEDEINYDQFILRVSYKEIGNLPSIVRKFWQNLSSENFVNMQEKAREAFETKLRMDKFLPLAFEKYL